MQIFNRYDTHTGKISLSKGNQIKINIDNIWYKADYLGYEGASEIAASDLLCESNITDIVPFVKYDFANITLNNTTYNGCKSYDFTNNKEIVTLDEFFLLYTGKRAEYYLNNLSIKDKIKTVVDVIQSNTKINNFGEYLTLLLELDSFIYNEDRHFNNIALLKDKYENYELCPVFDNGAAFLSDINEYGKCQKIGLIRKEVKSKPFSEDFNEQMQICRDLYNPQLKFDNNLELSQNAGNQILDNYDHYVISRIENTIEFSKRIHEDMLEPCKNKEY